MGRNGPIRVSVHDDSPLTTRVPFCPRQSHRKAREQKRSQLSLKKQRRTQEFLAPHARVSNLYQHTRITVPALNRRRNQAKAHLAWQHAVDAAV